MRNFLIVLVEPQYEINMGYAARVMKNFGFTNLCLVNPKKKPGFEAKMFAKHAKEVLERAVVVRDFKAAVKDCDVVVGTTAIRNGRETLRNPMDLEEFVKKIYGKHGRIALVFGREGTGLDAEEIKECDFLISIPTSPHYPSLNITHAMAIVLYSVHTACQKTMGFKKTRMARRKERDILLRMFNEIVDLHKKHLRNPQKVKLAFKRVLGKSLANDNEVASLMCIFKKLKEEGGKRAIASCA
ncbi:MAG: RNA methyltransferase [Candidatus Micrarchaeia archaeon]